MSLVQRLARRVSVRGFATSTAPPPKDVNVTMEIAMGLGLGLVFAVGWEMMVRGEIAKIDAFNAKLKQAKKDGLL